MGKIEPEYERKSYELPPKGTYFARVDDEGVTEDGEGEKRRIVVRSLIEQVVECQDESVDPEDIIGRPILDSFPMFMKRDIGCRWLLGMCLSAGWKIREKDRDSEYIQSEEFFEEIRAKLPGHGFGFDFDHQKGKDKDTGEPRMFGRFTHYYTEEELLEMRKGKTKGKGKPEDKEEKGTKKKTTGW